MGADTNPFFAGAEAPGDVVADVSKEDAVELEDEINRDCSFVIIH